MQVKVTKVVIPKTKILIHKNEEYNNGFIRRHSVIEIGVK